VLRHRLQWLTTTTRDNRGVVLDSTTTAELMPAAAVVAPTTTPPPSPLTAAMATPRGPSTLTLGPAPFKCGLVPGGRRPTASPVDHDGRRSPLWSPSVAGRLNFCVTPSASTSSGVATVDDPRRPPLRPSSVAGCPDLHTALAASTTGIMVTVDELLEPAATGSLLPHHDDGSFHGHQLGCRFLCLQPYHFQCR
jgi:hypothetical protein